MANNELSPMEEKYIQNLIKGMNQTEAYRNAGYKSKKESWLNERASRKFKEPKIQKRYRELMDKVNNEAILTAEQIQEMLSRIALREEGEREVLFTKDGEKREYERPAKLDTIVRALQELNKMQGNNWNNIKLEDQRENTKLDKILEQLEDNDE